MRRSESGVAPSLITAASSPSLPIVIISLDFELRWGMHDILGLNPSAYRTNLEQVHTVIPRLLRIFAIHNIHATWATVGAIGCKNWDEYFVRAPSPPKYRNAKLAVKPEYAEIDPKGDLHFAPDLLETISATAGQDLGTHTFSHLYLRESGVTETDVSADLTAVKKLWAERFGRAPRSLVFPRNQCAFLDTVRASSIRIWRGNEVPWYYDCRDSDTDKLLPKALRFSDGINPLRRLAAPLEGDMTRASLFLRLRLPRPLWALHFQRIKREIAMLRATDVFHIWFHPENFGTDMAERITRVEQVADLIGETQSRGRITSRSMGDLVSEDATFEVARIRALSQ